MVRLNETVYLFYARLLALFYFYLTVPQAYSLG